LKSVRQKDSTDKLALGFQATLHVPTGNSLMMVT